MAEPLKNTPGGSEQAGRMDKPLTMLEGFARLDAAAWHMNAQFCRAMPVKSSAEAAAYCGRRRDEATARADRHRKDVTDDE